MDNYTQPKRLGGLGIRNLITMNFARLMKLGWAIRNGKQSLWCDVLKGKYGRGTLDDGRVQMKNFDSSL